MMNIFSRILGLALLALTASGGAYAQSTNFGFSPVGSTQTISATASSSNVLLDASPGNSVLLQNTGPSTAYIKCSATAAVTDFPLQSGWSVVLQCPPSNRVAAITASSTASVTVTKGLGNTAIAGSGAVTISSGTVAATQSGTWTVQPGNTANTTPWLVSTSPYPTASTAITGNAAGSTAAVVGTLAGASSKTTYICGFNVQAIGGTATVGPITVAGLVGSSQVYQTDVNSATVGKQVASASFTPCIPASATNTPITVTTTANGTATAVNVNSWGFQQ